MLFPHVPPPKKNELGFIQMKPDEIWPCFSSNSNESQSKSDLQFPSVSGAESFLLGQIKSDTALLLEKDNELLGSTAMSQKATELEFREVPDAEALRKLLEQANMAEPFGSEAARSPLRADRGNELPSTLAEALRTKGCMFNALYRLALRLRNTKGGMDTGFLPNALNCRRAARTLNWYQYLGFTRCNLNKSMNLIESLKK